MSSITSISAKLPDLNHFNIEDYENFYEPSDDTFLLCDALLADVQEILQTNPQSCLEIGSGSGCVITYVSQLIESRKSDYIHGQNTDAPNPIFFAIDINENAANATKQTARMNNQHIDVICTDFNSKSFLSMPNWSRSISLIIFNPPYVPTPNDEIGTTDIAAAWAGGENGRVVIDKFLPMIKELLSPDGICYLLLVEDNKPKEVIASLAELGFSAETVIKRRARNELLRVLRIRPNK